MKKIILVSILIGAGLCATNALGARIKFSDIPGDGVITCGPEASFQPVCPGGVGTVSLLSGQLTGSLQQGGAILGFSLTQSPAVLSFTVDPAALNNPPDYDPLWLGPLGLNPEFRPTADHVGTVGLPAKLPPSVAYFDATLPVAGQEITLRIRNGGAQTLRTVSFFLGRDVSSLSTISNRQDDGLTFGLYCAGKTHAEGTSDDCGLSSNWKLLLTPSGPGTLNPADMNSQTNTFGDVLRFNGVDLRPGDTGQFSFFVTDYTSTRTPPGGVFTPANQSFVVEAEGNVQAVPEPGSLSLVSFATALILGIRVTGLLLDADFSHDAPPSLVLPQRPVLRVDSQVDHLKGTLFQTFVQKVECLVSVAQRAICNGQVTGRDVSFVFISNGL
jgi:hypothetical protein